MVLQQLRLYLPGTMSRIAEQIFPGMVREVRPAYAVPGTARGQPSPPIVNVWHVEFEEHMGTSPKQCAPTGLPRHYDEISQLNQPKSGQKRHAIFTTTYLRRDVPTVDRLDPFKELDEGNQGIVRIYKGQHPDLSQARHRADGSIVIADPSNIADIVRALEKNSITNYCMTQEARLYP